MIVACSSGSRGGRTWMYCDASLTYWLSEPSTSRPKRPATRQRFPAPRRHESQRPQAMMGLMMTCCPGFTSDTPIIACGRCDSCRSEEHTSELQSLTNLVCRLLLENKIQARLD